MSSLHCNGSCNVAILQPRWLTLQCVVATSKQCGCNIATAWLPRCNNDCNVATRLQRCNTLVATLQHLGCNVATNQCNVATVVATVHVRGYAALASGAARVDSTARARKGLRKCESARWRGCVVAKVQGRELSRRRGLGVVWVRGGKGFEAARV